jgi:hypothetical protein
MASMAMLNKQRVAFGCFWQFYMDAQPRVLARIWTTGGRPKGPVQRWHPGSANAQGKSVGRCLGGVNSGVTFLGNFEESFASRAFGCIRMIHYYPLFISLIDIDIFSKYLSIPILMIH